MSDVARRALVTGRVQGVAFRHHAKLEARARGLRGWVRNRDDGSVEAWLEGDAEDVDTMIAWLRRGPPMARVADVAVEDVTPAGHDRFAVRLDRGP